MIVTVNGQNIYTSDEELIVSESVDIYECEFEFDDSWDGWDKTARFEGSGVAKEMILINDKTSIPDEVIKEDGWMRVGVFGTRNAQVMPTIWGADVYVRHGTEHESTEITPTPSIYAQILALVNSANDTVEAVQDAWEAVTASASTLPVGSSATVSFSDNNFAFGLPTGATGATGATGNGIQSIAKTGTSGLVDTYTITFTNGSTTTFTVTNGEKGDTGNTGATGNGISSITKTGTSGLVDTYTIAFTDGTSTTFTVTNGEDVNTSDLAPAYSSSNTYAVGDYCIYSSQLYRCTTAITTAEAWTAAHWTAVTMGEDVSDLKSALEKSLFLLTDNYIDVKNIDLWKQGTISSTGVISDAQTQSNIYTEALFTFPIKFKISNLQSMYLCKYLDGVFIGRTALIGTTQGEITFDNTFDSYRLMLTNSYTSTLTVEEMISMIEYIESSKKTKDDAFDNEVAVKIATTLKDASMFVRGYIDNGGRPLDNSTNGAITTVTLKIPIVFNIPNTLRYNIVIYNDGVFVSRGGWVDGTGENVTVSENEYKIIFAQRVTVSEYEIDDTLDLITYISTKNQYDIEEAGKLKSQLAYINKINCTWTGNKICHYSVDDTYSILKDLTDNAETYTSIFDNATLAAVRNIHNSTGLCITFNTFNTLTTDSSYSISNVPEKAAFQAEFQANKNWLKFAFHAEDDLANYASTTGILTSYNTFVSAIYKLTGDYDCIDTFTRLGYFGGTLENVLAIKNASHGITGLLCADTTNRDSYYLTSDQNKIVQQKGMYVDAENELIMLKTITRTLANASAEIEGNLCYQKYVEVFSHEYEGSWITSCNTIATWLKNNGYVFAFPSLIFDI